MKISEGVFANFEWVAATAAPNSDHGCFFSRGLHVRRFQIILPPSGLRAKSNRDVFRPLLSHEYLDGRALWKSNMDQSPLLTRAWVAQERLLAPRILHFARDEMFWECNSLIGCETFTTWISGTNPLMDLKTGFTKLDVNLKPSECLKWWSTLQNLYSSMAITQTPDRLPAIAGIARSFGRLTGWKYHAGLWGHQLETQLIWLCDRKKSKHHHRPVGSGVPTWSCKYPFPQVAIAFLIWWLWRLQRDNLWMNVGF